MTKNFNTNYYFALVKRFVNSKYSWYKNISYTKDEIVAFCIRFGAAEDHEKELINKIVEKALTEYYIMGNIRANGDQIQTRKKVTYNIALQNDYFNNEDVNSEAKNLVVEMDEEPAQKLEYISLEELSKFDYKRFGAMLKQKKLLPPSYDRKPADVEVYANNASCPMVKITFKSTTSDSYRVFKITPSDIYEYINGSNEGRIYRDEERYQGIRETWKSFKDASLWSLNYQENRMIDYKIREIEREASKIGAMKLLKEVESEFIKTHYNSKFEGFYDSWGVPHFSLPRYVEGKRSGYEKVTPMTPKTLELCVLRLEKEAKLDEADDLEWFKDKCKQIEEKSVYPGDWNEPTERLVDYLVKFKNASQVTFEEE